MRASAPGLCGAAHALAPRARTETALCRAIGRMSLLFSSSRAPAVSAASRPPPPSPSLLWPAALLARPRGRPGVDLVRLSGAARRVRASAPGLCGAAHALAPRARTETALCRAIGRMSLLFSSSRAPAVSAASRPQRVGARPPARSRPLRPARQGAVIRPVPHRSSWTSSRWPWSSWSSWTSSTAHAGSGSGGGRSSTPPVLSLRWDRLSALGGRSF